MQVTSSATTLRGTKNLKNNFLVRAIEKYEIDSWMAIVELEANGKLKFKLENFEICSASILALSCHNQ